MKSISITLDGVKPVSKKNKMRVGRGRVWKCSEVEQFEKLLTSAAVEAASAAGWVSSRAPMKLTLNIQMGDKRRRDLQNQLDTICDSLQGIIYEDDSQIVHIIAKKWSGSGWKIEINVEEL